MKKKKSYMVVQFFKYLGSQYNVKYFQLIQINAKSCGDMVGDAKNRI